ncbi:protein MICRORCHIDIA 7-like [Phalaenopsis equestris]|uniref:protein MICRORCHIDIA 7-like n=1 Tax=Phalaenopsis equestris TaxID=78828 RepID=UPI0009E397F0|nr:protein MICRORCHIDIA 7-like [Phalaenopsis equestris]
MKSEMGVPRKPTVGSDAEVSAPCISGGVCGDVRKRARVLSCGLEEEDSVKRARQGFFLDRNNAKVFSPMPLSMRPIGPLPSANPIPQFFTSRPLAPLSPALPAIPLSAVPLPRSVESPSSSTFRLGSPPLKQVKDENKNEGNSCRQFWKAGDFEGQTESSSSFSADIDRVRVHPKFLHSNATSHKWALGALAELLDNSIDEICNGATFVNIDVLENPKDQTKMLFIEDNGGGMDPDKLRQCMSLGYSMKSKSTNTIGQYGNGFKTSTMRLGADVIVFSRCQANMCPTQSIGILSYTFLKKTEKQDIIVPMIDYEKKDNDWHRMERSSSVAWKTNLDLILQWSPYNSEADLLQQFNLMADQGTRIIIYNLWEDDEGQLELDFVTDAQDIQIRGANRDEKKIEMSKNFPNSRHFLTYHHSMRSYASILYLRLPQSFRIILRGKEIEHHNIINDMMMKEEKTYRPQPALDGVPKDLNIFAVVTIGFVKDATNHIDVQGFNVYHKNRLIKPFWRIWNAAGSDGRGVIGVLEANFIEPAHDKQGFERTTVLNRLEACLLRIQKTYWLSNCQKIGYAPRRHKKSISNSEDNETSPETPQQLCTKPTITEAHTIVQSLDSIRHQNSGKLSLHSDDAKESSSSIKLDELRNYDKMLGKGDKCSVSSSNYYGYGQSQTECEPNKQLLDGYKEKNCVDSYLNGLKPQDLGMHAKLLADQNKALKERIVTVEGKLLHDLKMAMEKNKHLLEKVEFLEKRLKDADKEQETIINIFVEERERRDAEEEKWRIRLKVANNRIKNLENLAMHGVKSELQ